jgi:methylglyoxal/glyoxal reductase
MSPDQELAVEHCRQTLSAVAPSIQVAMDRSVEVTKGVHMPRVGLGTFRLKGKAATTAVLAALESGYRHIDTASIYKNYKAIREGMVASGVPREDLFITSKISPYELGTERTKAAFQECLDELGAKIYF